MDLLQLHLKNIVENLPFSMGVSAITYGITSSLGIHVEMLFIFGIIVALDILTRWLACSRELWISLYPQTPCTLYDCFSFLWQSHRWRFFDSNKMRKGFWSKMLTYIILMLVSGLADWMIGVYGGKRYILMIVIYILTATEVISCLENLEEAGVSIASEIKKIVKTKKDKVI